MVGLCPVIEDAVLPLSIVTDLQGDVRIGMPIVGISPFMLLAELDINLFVEPGLDGDMGVVFLIALKSVFFLPFVGGYFLIVLDQ